MKKVMFEIEPPKAERVELAAVGHVTKKGPFRIQILKGNYWITMEPCELIPNPPIAAKANSINHRYDYFANYRIHAKDGPCHLEVIPLAPVKRH